MDVVGRGLTFRLLECSLYNCELSKVINGVLVPHEVIRAYS